MIVELAGAYSTRLRAGALPVDPLAPRFEVDDRPSPQAIRDAAGFGYGAGPTRTRAGDEVFFTVMAMLQTNGGSITREVGQFGGADGLQAAELHRAYWAAQPSTLVTWIV